MTGAEAMKALEESKLAANVAGEVARILMSGMQCPRFGPGAPTIPEVAAIFKQSQQQREVATAASENHEFKSDKSNNSGSSILEVQLTIRR